MFELTNIPLRWIFNRNLRFKIIKYYQKHLTLTIQLRFPEASHTCHEYRKIKLSKSVLRFLRICISNASVPYDTSPAPNNNNEHSNKTFFSIPVCKYICHKTCEDKVSSDPLAIASSRPDAPRRTTRVLRLARARVTSKRISIYNRAAPSQKLCDRVESTSSYMKRLSPSRLARCTSWCSNKSPVPRTRETKRSATRPFHRGR